MKCPYCAESIEDDALKCPSCGEAVDEALEPAPSGTSKTVLIVLLVAFVFTLLVCVAGWFLVMNALRSARKKTQVAIARSQIGALSAGLAMYEADHGRFPRLAPRTGAGLFYDDSPSLYAALANQPASATGGGVNSPYLMDWRPKHVGKLSAPKHRKPGFMGDDWTVANPAGVTPLAPAEHTQLNQLAFQVKNSPTTATPLVYLDPWGNPFHYREWASIRAADKQGLTAARRVRGPGPLGDAPISGVMDEPYDLDSFQLWSNGPNGINEYGHPRSDDVTSWVR